MKHVLALCVALCAASGAEAACYADYKAKQDNPLQLHYGVVKLSNGSCPSTGAAQQQIAGRISSEGWQLLNVLSVFSNTPSTRQKANAGQYYLRY